MAGTITVIGLGPGDPALITAAAQAAIDNASRIILRTGIHPGLAPLLRDPRVLTCDDLYETHTTFDAVYQAIAERVMTAARDGNVIYAVPGHPLIGEASVRTLLLAAPASGLAVTLQPAVSALDVVATALGVDLLAEQVQMIDAAALDQLIQSTPFAGGQLGISPVRPVLLTQVYEQSIASSAKLALSRIFPDDHPIVIVRAADVPGEEAIVSCQLYELDRQPIDHLTSVWLPAQMDLEAYRSFETLQRIVARLRAPDGCPWDRKQTHASLRTSILEEAYEVVDAIDQKDPASLLEELGDLMLLVCMQAQIAEELGEFELEDAIAYVTRKLIRRHPHVFGDVTADNPEAVIKTWQAVKAQERRDRGETEPAAPVHPLDRLPRSMPAWLRTQHVLEDAAPAAEPVSYAEAEAAGDELLRAVETLVQAGRDPGDELEQALRRRDAIGTTNNRVNATK